MGIAFGTSVHNESYSKEMNVNVLSVTRSTGNAASLGMFGKNRSYGAWLAAAIALSGASAHAGVLTHQTVSILSSGGSGGAGASTSDMVYKVWNNSDGWGWAGGAGAVQGNLAVTNSGGYSAAANETFKFNVGAIVDSLNATYGAGAWTIANPKLSFSSSYSIQNNSRFGRGAGSFDIYWVAKDSWAQTKGTTTDRQANPIYASTAADLSSWSGGQSLLGSEPFSYSSSKSGYVPLSYDLSATSSLVNDVVSASASGSNSAVSLYLMGTSDTLGMIIFTGGQNQPLPSLSFDVVSVASVPEPAALSLAGVAVVLLRRRKVDKPAIDSR